MTTICSMKVPPQLDDSGQEQFCDSTNKFHYLSSNTIDAHPITNCGGAPLDVSKHGLAIENKETEIELGAGNLHMKKAKFESGAPTRTQLVVLVLSTGEEVPIVTKTRTPLSELLSPALMLRSMITKPLLNGLTEKSSSNISIIRNKTGCASNVYNVKEEQPRRPFLHEFKLMNSENLLMNFDPGGKWLKEPSEDDGQNQSRVVSMEEQSPWILFGGFICSHVRPATTFGLIANHELFLCLQLAHDGSTLAWNSNYGADHTKLLVTLKGHSLTTLMLVVEAKGLFSSSGGSTIYTWYFESRQCVKFVIENTNVVIPLLCLGCYLLSVLIEHTLKMSPLKAVGNAFIIPLLAQGFISKFIDLILDKEFIPGTMIVHGEGWVMDICSMEVNIEVLVERLRIADVYYIPLTKVLERLGHILKHLKGMNMYASGGEEELKAKGQEIVGLSPSSARTWVFIKLVSGKSHNILIECHSNETCSDDFFPYPTSANGNQEDKMDDLFSVERSYSHKNILHVFMQFFFATRSKIVMFPFHPGESYICISDGHRECCLFMTRGRVIPWESWNDVDTYDNIEAKISLVTISSCMNGLSRELLRLFHKVVNGLDPPMDLDGACEASMWIPMSSLVDEL